MRCPPTVARLLCCGALLLSFPAGASPQLGVYRWDVPDGPSNVDAFSAWLGAPVTLAHAFEASDTWDLVDGAEWQLGPWSQWTRAQPGRNLVLGVPMLPGAHDLSGPDGIPGTADDPSLAKCGAGAYDARWARLASELSRFGLHRAYLRLGWEMDGGWYAWRARPGDGNEASYAACFRRIVRVMRGAQPASQWQFVWNPTTAWHDTQYLDAVWPGNPYVDVVALDIYDQSWAANTYPYPAACDAACRLERQRAAWRRQAWYLHAMRDFAAAHGKPLAIPEWGVALRPDGHGGGDNLHFVRRMHEFIHDPANRVVFHAYFNVSAPDIDGRLTGPVRGDAPGGPTSFPQAAEMVQALFGSRPRAGRH